MQNRQNIYDNEDFFEGYRELRERTNNYNVLLEQPAFYQMLPELKEKSVLDLGCGAGDSCRTFQAMGAKRVVGIDVSKNMLSLARAESDGIEYHQMDMLDISAWENQFDVITSSLAVHYVADFDALLFSVYTALKENGTFVFSQEHPLTTAPKRGAGYTRAEDGTPLYYNLSDYSCDGERQTTWFVDGVIKYHRSFSSIVNSLIRAGFRMERLCEPLPDEVAVAANPGMKKEFHKPSFLMVRASK